MRIYTKTGDSGETSLIGGTRVPKHHLRIESYGTVDELNSFIGMIRDTNSNHPELIAVLAAVQDRLFTIGSLLAADPGKSKMKLPELTDDDVSGLEKEIDKMNEELPELTSFILPGGHVDASWCHLARCVCRRSERLVSHLAENAHVNPIIIPYLNRLSDYLFVLSRKVLKDRNGVEITWNPKI
ncbi:MAG: cob(I)yrinic acid a,c-diamide adenosyltransferase [Bacteroidota bacterium]